MVGMIDFYKVYASLYRSNSTYRKEYLENLTKQILEEYSVTLPVKIKINDDPNSLGYFNPYEKELTIFDKNVFEKELKQKNYVRNYRITSSRTVTC